MKRSAIILAVLLLVGLMAACGDKKTETADVDLTGLYTSVEKEYDWDGYMSDIEGEMLESFYPGLKDIPASQFVAKAPMMSYVVSEVVFMQCETEEDAAKAAAILQQRIDTQAEGGAWYPDSVEAWGKATVIQKGTYLAMIASAEHQDEIAERFSKAFA